MAFPRRTAALAALFLAGVITGQAAMYRWVDENGITVYSQTAPVGSAWVRIDGRAGPSPAEQQAAEARLQQQMEQSFDAAEAKEAAAAEAAAKRQLAEQRSAACEAARHNRKTLRNLGPRMVRTSDGEYKRMTQDEVAAGIEEAELKIKEFCNQ